MWHRCGTKSEDKRLLGSWCLLVPAWSGLRWLVGCEAAGVVYRPGKFPGAAVQRGLVDQDAHEDLIGVAGGVGEVGQLLAHDGVEQFVVTLQRGSGLLDGDLVVGVSGA
jgi:hypothetical protein